MFQNVTLMQASPFELKEGNLACTFRVEAGGEVSVADKLDASNNRISGCKS
jgi:hypothetical protein